MTALVVYESVYGNTREVAEAVAAGLGDARVVSVQEAIEHAHKAELLVVGSRGHGSMAGALLGSVSQRVAAHGHCPVVIIRHEFAHDADPGSQGVADPASVTPATT